jgi:hypothetical protein
MLTNRLMLFMGITYYGKNNKKPEDAVWTKCKTAGTADAPKQHCSPKGQTDTKLLFTTTWNSRVMHYVPWHNAVAVLKVLNVNEYVSLFLWQVNLCTWRCEGEGCYSDNVNALCYLCWHGVFSCASVSFPVSELCTHCSHNERNVVSRCLPAPASSHTQYVIIGFLYIHATRVLLYFTANEDGNNTRQRDFRYNKTCTQKRPTKLRK